MSCFFVRTAVRENNRRYIGVRSWSIKQQLRGIETAVDFRKDVSGGISTVHPCIIFDEMYLCSYDFLLVLAKKTVNFLSTLLLSHFGHLIFG
jgi:predicted RNase H-like nuclease